MKSNFWFCSCGKRVSKVGDVYQEHIDNGDHASRMDEKRRRKAERSQEQRRRDNAAAAMEITTELSS